MANAPAMALRQIDYTKAKATPTVCFGCTTQCQVLGWVQDDRVVRISGNPIDPNTHGHICAKADGLIAATYYPERLLYPLKRLGKRGEGKWQRITWDEALDTIAARLQKLRDEGRPDKFGIQVGRDKTQGLIGRFLSAVGSPTALNRRSICSSNNRLGTMTYYGTAMDWGQPDLARTQYVLNFGSNLMEAHQGGFGGIQRLQAARLDHGAKLVTFEIRPSATASISDEYYAVNPGSDGAIAMAMAHVIVREGLADRRFWDRWCNIPFDAIAKHLQPFTPAFAEQESRVPAAIIERLAVEFASAAPRCTTLLNRGAAKHYNGIHACRAVFLLDILVGSVGKPGGFSIVNRGAWNGGWGLEGLPIIEQPGPRPPRPPAWQPGMAAFDELPDSVKARYAKLPEDWKAKYRGELITPTDYPLAWHWQGMKVGQMNYPWIKEGRAKIDTLMTYVFNGAYGYPEAKVCRDVLLDETLIPFLVSIDIAYSETAACADIILPEATALERWDAQVTNAWDLVPLTAIRQPLTSPPGEAHSVWWIFQQLAKRLGPEVYQYWDFPSEEAFYKQWYKNLPISWEELKRRGVWWDASRQPDYALFERPLSAKEMEGATIDEKTGLIRKDSKGKPTVIGIMLDGQAVRGFPSRSRKIEVWQEAFPLAAKIVGLEQDPIAQPLPTYFRVPSHAQMQTGELKFVTFKWNVHTQGRTAHHKYQAEIVHGNPVWIAPETASQLDLQDGDWVEVSVKRPVGAVWGAAEDTVCGSFKQYIRVVPGVAPGTLACSHHLGHWEFGQVGSGKLRATPPAIAGMDPDLLADRDIPDNVWWAKSKGGIGTGVHINDAMPIAPTPLSGGQMWYDCVCTVRKI
jgi:anaerobic selenocysteine-containing dehydrogenase